jgi:C1A family cysteine protease
MRYGWIPDVPDQRDYRFAAAPQILTALPPRVDLRPLLPPGVYDQGQLGSCTAQAIAAALEFLQRKQQQKDLFTPSRLFIYYNERAMEGTINEDAGAMIRDGIKSVTKQGAPHESLWPYRIDRFASKPPAKAYTDALQHQAITYARIVQTRTHLKSCLASGFPFVFGFAVYESFESLAVERTGAIPMPKRGERMLGGHAVLGVGYDEATGLVKGRNSYGSNWGDHGHFTIPFAYLTNSNLADDFWAIRSVE